METVSVGGEAADLICCNSCFEIKVVEVQNCGIHDLGFDYKQLAHI